MRKRSQKTGFILLAATGHLVFADPALAQKGHDSDAPAAAESKRFSIDRTYGKEGPWLIAWNEARRQCFAVASYSGGTSILIGFNGEKQSGSLALFNSQWSGVVPGKKYSVSFVFDRRSRFRGEMVGAQSESGAGFDLDGANMQFIATVVAGKDLQIFVEGRKLDRFLLNGTKSALIATLKCQQSASRETAADQKNETFSAGTAYNREALDAARKKELEAFKLLKNGNYLGAEQSFKSALEIAERLLGSENPRVAHILGEIGDVYFEIARYAEAEDNYKKSLAIFKKNADINEPDIGSLLSTLGRTYRAQGKYKEGIESYELSKNIAKHIYGDDSRAMSVVLNGLANIYSDLGYYDESRRLYLQTLRIDEKLASDNGDYADVSKDLNNIGVLYLAMGDFDEAANALKRAVEISEKTSKPDDPHLATDLDNLAAAYQGLHHYDEAEKLRERSITIYEKAFGPSNRHLAIALNNLAHLFFDQGRISDAESLEKRALAMSEQEMGQSHIDVAYRLWFLADIVRLNGRYSEAEGLLKRAMSIIKNVFGESHPAFEGVSDDLASLYAEQSKFSLGLPLVEKSIASGGVDPPTAYETLIGAQKVGLRSDTQTLELSYSVLQFGGSQAGGAIEKLAQRLSARSPLLAQLIRRNQDLEAEGASLDKTLMATVSGEPSKRDLAAEERLRKREEEIKADREGANKSIEAQFPDYVAFSKPQPMNIEETQKLLGEDEALVAFAIEGKKSYAWVVSKGAASWIEIPVDTKTLNEQVKLLRQSLTFNVDAPFDAALSYKIYQETFGPIADKLAGKKRLSIYTNGALTSLPMSLLVTSDPATKGLKDTDWLAKSYATTILPSIYSLKTMRAQAVGVAATMPMIAFADPVFSRSARAEAKAQQITSRSLPSFYRGVQVDVAALGEALPQLPGTRGEVEKVAKAVGAQQSDIKLGLEATVPAVETAPLDRYRILYFATHGLVAGELAQFAKAKAEPSLVLTIPEKPTEHDNGLLPASDVATLKLNADWVVLSACNTAAGDVVGAEALSGLARAFIYAGGRSLIVSNWDVSDDGAADLMTKLFNIASKHPELSHGEALQQAELAMLAQSKSDDELHPRYWAPFVVVGEPRKPNM